MRRHRQIREYRERMLRMRSRKMSSGLLVRSKTVHKIKKSKFETSNVSIKNRTSSSVNPYKFLDYHQYKCVLNKQINVCHIIESFGLGGAQIMMIELINALNKYFGEYVCNKIICTDTRNDDKNLYSSYSIHPFFIHKEQLKEFCQSNHIQIVIHHRISQSQNICKLVPKYTKTILINHTYNNLSNMVNLDGYTAYVNVCDFLNEKTNFPENVSDTSKFTILNGAENDYLESFSPKHLIGSFRTGRCHRMVMGKFKPDSLDWLETMSHTIPGLTHYLIGACKDAKRKQKRWSGLHYLGSITNRNEKMSIVKGLDIYFYETASHEGASMAILESLACGVPVLCKPLGGCAELIKDNINGFICRDRNDFAMRFKQLSSDTKLLQSLKDSTIKDFNQRLHIKHTAAKYMQLFEKIINL